ncbi:hypothetical protein Tco_1411697 [Tanacetum coccineum]
MLPIVISYVNAAIDTTTIGFKRRSPGCIFTLTACTLGLGPGCICTLTAITKWECSSYGRALALHARGMGFDTSAGNPVKEILLKLNLPDHSNEVLNLKNFKKDATLKLFTSTNQERCSRSHSRQAKEQAQDLKFMITTSNHKLMIEVKDYELKTKVEA